MKTVLTFALPMIFSLFLSNLVLGQTSKSCGSCQKSVSIHSQVGDYCPHCHGRWGYENTTTKNVNRPVQRSYDNITGLAYVTSNANLRSFASKSAYVIKVLPRFTMVNVVGAYGDWYQVEYTGINFIVSGKTN